MPKHTLQPDDQNITVSFQSLKNWMEDSLDIFRDELIQLLYPLFIHTYFDLIIQNKDSVEFFNTFKNEFPDKKSEISMFQSIHDVYHLRENQMAMTYRSNKYHIKIGKYAFDLFMSYLEENNLTQILKLVSHYFDIKVYIGSKKEESEGLVGPIPENTPVNLATSLFTKECEEAILNDEKYKYDHVETFVQQLKKQRDQDEKSINPNANYINAEIEKLKDLCKKIGVNKSNLPSICCYTVHNTYDKLTCSEISDDLKFIALGYQDSYIEVHSLSEPMKKLKTSSELGKSDQEDIYDDIGNTYKLVGHSGPVYGVKFFPGNNRLLSCSQDCTTRLWHLDLMTCIAVYKSHVFPIWTIDISSNDRHFMTGSADRTVCVWDIASLKPVRLLVSALSDVTCVKFHPNGNYVFYGSTDMKIRMHNIQDGALLRTFSGHTDGLVCIAISHCGKFMLSGGRDKQVILWDINLGKHIIKFTGHEDVVFSVGFCYFGSVLVSAGGDNTIRLWDRSDVKGSCLGVYSTKTTTIQCVKFGYRNIISAVGPKTN